MPAAAAAPGPGRCPHHALDDTPPAAPSQESRTAFVARKNSARNPADTAAFLAVSCSCSCTVRTAAAAPTMAADAPTRARLARIRYLVWSSIGACCDQQRGRGGSESKGPGSRQGRCSRHGAGAAWGVQQARGDGRAASRGRVGGWVGGWEFCRAFVRLLLTGTVVVVSEWHVTGHRGSPPAQPRPPRRSAPHPSPTMPLDRATPGRPLPSRQADRLMRQPSLPYTAPCTASGFLHLGRPWCGRDLGDTQQHCTFPACPAHTRLVQRRQPRTCSTCVLTACSPASDTNCSTMPPTAPASAMPPAIVSGENCFGPGSLGPRSLSVPVLTNCFRPASPPAKPPIAPTAAGGARRQARGAHIRDTHGSVAVRGEQAWLCIVSTAMTARCASCARGLSVHTQHAAQSTARCAGRFTRAQQEAVLEMSGALFFRMGCAPASHADMTLHAQPCEAAPPPPVADHHHHPRPPLPPETHAYTLIHSTGAKWHQPAHAQQHSVLLLLLLLLTHGADILLPGVLLGVVHNHAALGTRLAQLQLAARVGRAVSAVRVRGRERARQG